MKLAPEIRLRSSALADLVPLRFLLEEGGDSFLWVASNDKPLVVRAPFPLLTFPLGFLRHSGYYYPSSFCLPVVGAPAGDRTRKCREAARECKSRLSASSSTGARERTPDVGTERPLYHAVPALCGPSSATLNPSSFTTLLLPVQTHSRTNTSAPRNDALFFLWSRWLIQDLGEILAEWIGSTKPKQATRWRGVSCQHSQRSPLLLDVTQITENRHPEWRGHRKYSPIGWFTVGLRPKLHLFIAQHTFKRGVTGGKGIAEIIKVEHLVFESISDFYGRQRFWMNLREKTPNRVCQAWSSAINHRKKLGHFSLSIRSYWDAIRQNANGFPQSSNFGIKKIAALHSIFQVNERFIEGFYVLIRSHKLCPEA